MLRYECSPTRRGCANSHERPTLLWQPTHAPDGCLAGRLVALRAVGSEPGCENAQDFPASRDSSRTSPPDVSPGPCGTRHSRPLPWGARTSRTLRSSGGTRCRATCPPWGACRRAACDTGRTASPAYRGTRAADPGGAEIRLTRSNVAIFPLSRCGAAEDRRRPRSEAPVGHLVAGVVVALRAAPFSACTACGNRPYVGRQVLVAFHASRVGDPRWGPAGKSHVAREVRVHLTERHELCANRAGIPGRRGSRCTTRPGVAHGPRVEIRLHLVTG